MSSSKRQRWLPILIAAASATFIAVLGGTMTDIGPWYQQLQKPEWQPPDWLFGPAWTLIYAFIVMSAVYAWRDISSRQTREWLIGLFCFNGALNVFWSIIFFRLQRPDWALIEVVLFWFSILWLMFVLWKPSRLACLLLLPYLLWVTFAAFLNLEVVKLNQPF